MFGLSTRSSRRATVPAGARLYAIGDVHGRLDLLERLLSLIASDANDAGASQAQPQLIFLGDYVDRGPDSRGVVERIIEEQSRAPGVVALKGNHEAALLDFLADPGEGAIWLEWGGRETLQSYGLADVDRRAPADLADEFRQRLPFEHRSFYEGLTLSHIAGDYFFAHAGVRPGVPLAEQSPSDLMWIREAFHRAAASERPDKVVVHGHHPMERPRDFGWRIAVDTGAVWTGALSAVALEGRTGRFLSTAD